MDFDARFYSILTQAVWLLSCILYTSDYTIMQKKNNFDIVSYLKYPKRIVKNDYF